MNCLNVISILNPSIFNFKTLILALVIYVTLLMFYVDENISNLSLSSDNRSLLAYFDWSNSRPMMMVMSMSPSIRKVRSGNDPVWYTIAFVWPLLATKSSIIFSTTLITFLREKIRSLHGPTFKINSCKMALWNF